MEKKKVNLSESPFLYTLQISQYEVILVIITYS